MTSRYAIPLIGTVCFALPTLIPWYCFGETLNTAWHVALARYVLNLHGTFLVNSAAHLWGCKPYDKNIKPAQNLPVSFIAFGEGMYPLPVFSSGNGILTSTVVLL